MYDKILKDLFHTSINRIELIHYYGFESLASLKLIAGAHVCIIDALSFFPLYFCNIFVSGGKKIILFCKKVSRLDIEVHISYKDPKSKFHLIFFAFMPVFIIFEISAFEDQTLKGIFKPSNVHEQTGISFLTPSFPDQTIKERVRVSD